MTKVEPDTVVTSKEPFLRDGDTIQPGKSMIFIMMKIHIMYKYIALPAEGGKPEGRILAKQISVSPFQIKVKISVPDIVSRIIVRFE